MEFFIDTADVDAIKKLNDMGLVDGVTTNPTLVKKAGRDYKVIIREIAAIIKCPISVETIKEDAKGMVNEAKDFLTWVPEKDRKNIVIKIVMTPEGMKAVKELSGQKIKTNVTLIFSPLQALIAAKAGATYVSPFVGRLDDIGHDGMEIISQIRQIFDNYEFKTKILAASLRHPLHVMQSALFGADVATIPPDVMLKLFNHPLTDNGIKAFLDDAKQWKK